jgi:hypothetical protein
MALGALDFTAATMAAITGETERAAFHLGQIANRGFLEGFEWTDHSELFVAPSVRISEWENTLQSMVDNMNTSIMNDFDGKFTERMQAIKQGLEENPLEAKINIKPKGDLSSGLSSGLNSEVKMLQAVESRVMVRGSTEDPLLKLSEQQVKVLQDILNATVRRDENKTEFVLEPVT